MSKILRITSKRAGFRRAGIAHPSVPTDYPIEQFSEEQLAQIFNESMLTAALVEDDGDPGDEQKANTTAGEGSAAGAAAAAPAAEAAATHDTVSAKQEGPEAPANRPAPKAAAKPGKKAK